MDPRKQDFEPTVLGFDASIVEQWSQQFIMMDMERSAEIEGLSQHVLNQERMIDELRKNRNELTLDGLQIDEKIDEEKELFDIVVSIGRGNENLLKKIQNMTAICQKTLGDFHNFEKVAKELNETKTTRLYEHREKMSELKNLLTVMENQRARYCGIVSQVHACSVQHAEENSARIEEAVCEAKAVLRKLIDSQQLTGLDMPETLSITQKLQKAVEWAAKINGKVRKITTAQKERKRLYDEAIQQFLKELDGNSKVEEISQHGIDQLMEEEKLLMEEKKTVEEDSVERARVLNEIRGEIDGKKNKIAQLEFAVADNETFMEGMRSKMKEEHGAFVAKKQELENMLSEIKEQSMGEKLEGLFMKGRLQEVQNQVEQSRENSQSKLKELESEVTAHENAYKTAVQNYNDEEKTLQMCINQANVLVSQLKTEKLAIEKSIDAEKSSITKTANDVDKLHSAVENLKTSNQAAEVDFEGLVTEFKNLELEIDGLKKHRDHLSMVQGKLEQYEMEFSEVERARAESETVWTQIRDIEDNQQIKQRELNEQLQELRTAFNLMQSENINIEVTIQSKQFDIEKLDREVLELKNCIRLADDKLQRREQLSRKVEKRPRGRPPLKRAKVGTKTTSDWEALIRECVPIKQEKTELVPFVVPTVAPPTRAKKFFKSRQPVTAVGSTNSQREKKCDVFDYDSDDDVQFVRQVTKSKR